MSASRRRPKGAFRRPFGLIMSGVLVMPTSVGHQDLASLIARQPGIAERGRQHIRSATTLTALHTATFSFPRPLGTAIPEAPGYQLASLDPRALDVTGSIRRGDPFYDPFAERAPPPAPRYEFPTVDRRLKGDLLVRRGPQPVAPSVPQPKPRKPRERDHAAPAIPVPQTIPAFAGHEPFAIPQALIAEAARAAAQRDAAAKAAGEVMRAMREQPRAEPFAIPEAHIHAAELAEARRVAGAETEKRQTAEERTPASATPATTPTVDYPAVTAWAQREAEPFAIAEELIAEAERIAIARASEPMQKAEENAAAARDEEKAIDAGGGIPLVENNRILTDDEPRDEDVAAAEPAEPDNPAMQMAKLYFGADSFGDMRRLESYRPGEAPMLEAPPKPADPDIKLSVQTPPKTKPGGNIYDTPPGALDEEPLREGANTTIAAKGEVTGEGHRPRTPAERLGLSGASRARHERCLANAIYFEARGEAERGQMAVAQVVMNRVFSPYYPDNVCGVVYQNAHKHNACQFTFACDSVRDVVTEPEAWETAKRIARETLDGRIWLPEIGKATHYHATYVSPWWKRTMTKYKTLGIHIFYRPTRWGDGSDEPTWDPAQVEATGSIKAPDKSHADAFDKPRG